MLPIKLRYIWLLSFIGNFFLEIDQSKTRIAVAAMFEDGSKRNDQ